MKAAPENATNAVSDSTLRLRRRRIVSAVVLLTGLTAFGVFVAQRVLQRQQQTTQDEPLPPELNLASLPPEIAEGIRAARQDVIERPQSAEAWGRLGMLLRAHDFEQESNRCFEQAERLDPTDDRWPYLLGVTFAIRSPEAALGAFRRSIDANPEAPLPRFRFAELALDLDRLKEADAEFRALERMTQHDPMSQARALLGRARVEFLNGNIDVARRLAERSAGLAPRQRATHELLARIEHRLGNSSAASKQLEILNSLPAGRTQWPDPLVSDLIDLRRDADWEAARAQHLLRQGNAVAAARLFRQVVARRPGVAEYHGELARSLMLAGQLQEAAGELNAAIARHPKSSELRRLRGELQLGQKQFADGTKSFQEAIDRKPDHAQAWLGLARCLRGLKRSDDAIAAFRGAVRVDPSLWEAHATLGKLLIKRGDRKEGRRHLQAAIALRPDDVELQRLLPDKD